MTFISPFKPEPRRLKPLTSLHYACTRRNWSSISAGGLARHFVILFSICGCTGRLGFLRGGRAAVYKTAIDLRTCDHLNPLIVHNAFHHRLSGQLHMLAGVAVASDIAIDKYL